MRRLIPFLVVCAAIGGGFAAQEAWLEAAPLPGVIAITLDVGDQGNQDIYTIWADGSNLVRLTDTPGRDREPRWSRDGRKIAFSSDRDGDYEIYAMNADGSNLLRLTNDPAYDSGPSWSPDGARLSFTRGTREEGQFRTFTMNANGSNVQMVLTGWEFIEADWSPDGQYFIGSGFPQGHWEIVRVPVDGTGYTYLTNNDGQLNRNARYTPDGTKIVVGTYTSGSFGIATMEADGSSKTSLMATPGPEALPAWAPDGSRVLFHTGPDGNFAEIWIVNADGSDAHSLTGGLGLATFSDWQPIIRGNFRARAPAAARD